MTDLILNEKRMVFVAILKDENRNRSHAVGIDIGVRVIYDCMEEKVLGLNKENLSIYYGVNAVFHQI